MLHQSDRRIVDSRIQCNCLPKWTQAILRSDPSGSEPKDLSKTAGGLGYEASNLPAEMGFNEPLPSRSVGLDGRLNGEGLALELRRERR